MQKAKIEQFIEDFDAANNSDQIYSSYEGKMTPEELSDALKIYMGSNRPQMDKDGFQRFIIGEFSDPIISTGPARKLTKEEQKIVGPEERYEDDYR